MSDCNLSKSSCFPWKVVPQTGYNLRLCLMPFQCQAKWENDFRCLGVIPSALLLLSRVRFGFWQKVSMVTHGPLLLSCNHVFLSFSICTYVIGYFYLPTKLCNCPYLITSWSFAICIHFLKKSFWTLVLSLIELPALCNCYFLQLIQTRIIYNISMYLYVSFLYICTYSIIQVIQEDIW